MFRRSLLTATLLAGCGTKTITEPRIVAMPELDPAHIKVAPHDCKWRNAEISVFNQKDQNVSFRYTYCKRQRLAGFEYYSTGFGGKIMSVYEKGIQTPKIKVLEIWKLGPSTKRQSLDSYLAHKDSKQSCELLEINPNVYRVIDSSYKNLPGFDIIEDEPPNEFLARLKMYDNIHKERFLYATKCGGLGQHILAFADGIVFAIASPSVNYYIDYTSVTYENRG